MPSLKAFSRVKRGPVIPLRPIDYKDIPTREEFVDMTMRFLDDGVTNSDHMRDIICQQRHVILGVSHGEWNQSPSGKFVNEHAHVLRRLVTDGIIHRVGRKEYRLATG